MRDFELACFFGTFVKDLDLDRTSLAKEFDLDWDFAADFDRLALVDFDGGCDSNDDALSDCLARSLSPSEFNPLPSNSTLFSCESTKSG